MSAQTAHDLAEVREIAARLLHTARPDFKYEPPLPSTCLYFSDGQPSCFVGHVFSIWGDPRLVQAAEAADAEFIETGNGSSPEEVLRIAGIEVDEDALRYLANVQDFQDSGYTWRRSVLAAEHQEDLHPVYVRDCVYCDGPED